MLLKTQHVLFCVACLTFFLVGCEAAPKAKPTPEAKEVAPKKTQATVQEVTYLEYSKQANKALNTLFCRRTVECGDLARAISLPLAHFASVDDCLDFFAKQGEHLAQAIPIQQAIDSGAMKVDQEKVQACFNTIKNIPKLDCKGLHDLEATLASRMLCAYAAEGAKGQGDSCENSAQCARVDGQTLRCDGGICKETPSSQMPCGKACAEGEFCDGSGGTCQPTRKAGGKCVRDFQCAVDHRCNPDTTQCIRYLSAGKGDVCYGPHVCQYGLKCAPKENTSTKHCVPLNYLKQGDACRQGSSERCQRGLYCAPSKGSQEGKCAPLMALGEACKKSTQCTWGLFCKSSSTSNQGVCSKPMKEGASCSLGVLEPYQCSSGECDPETQACR